MKTKPIPRQGSLAGSAGAVALVLLGAAVSIPSPLLATTVPADLTELSLEALMDIEVTSVSRRPQKLANAAAAAFVISQDDIRRSGATTIPDLLRMVPGLQVAKIDANKWAVSIRGFNGRFANKLLVLKDGRSIYTPLFSGVYWEQQDTPLDDIERIEVLRGPGAAMWGANAVNGVINIITRSAAETRGGLLTAGGGNAEQGFGSLRFGFALGSASDLRVYGKYANHGPEPLDNGANNHDAWQSGSAGFRMDSRLSGQDRLTLQGDYFSGSFDENYTFYQLPTAADPRYSWSQDSRARADGGNLLARWQRTLSATDNLSLQLYYDHYQRTMTVLGETRDTVDLDFQHRFALGSRQELIWGLGYRYSHDKLAQTPYISFSKPELGVSLFSAFIQDEIRLVPDTLSLILGSRFEHNDFTGFEVQPNGRLIWTPSPFHSFWGSVSRAVRTPSRGDQSIRYRFRTMSPVDAELPIPLRLEIDGSSNFRSETVIAYELGYRSQLKQDLTLDLSLFFNQYDHLRVRQEGLQGVEATSAVLRYPLSNDMHGHTYGAELSATWRPADWWRLQAVYSYLCSIMYLDNGSTDEINRGDAAAGSPRHQGSLRSGFDLGRQLELDLWLRAVDQVAYIDGIRIPGYLTMDARIAWKPNKTVELSLVGQNLFQKRHPEYIPEFINTTASEVPRSVYAKLTWRF